MDSVIFMIGANIGDREAQLALARTALQERVGRILRASAVYETAPWGLTDQPPFLNQALTMETSLSPPSVLSAIQLIESQLGRTRELHWGPRLIDIDILLFGSRVMDTPDLQIPHPGIPDRRFVLVPLAEIAGEIHHPVLGATIRELLARTDDLLPVHKFAPRL